MNSFERGFAAWEAPKPIKESISKAPSSVHEKVFDAYVASQLRVWKKMYEQGGFAAVAQEQLRNQNARVEYRSEARPDFSEMRAKLNSESGIIIANHPYVFIDAPLILNTLTRDDIKIVVNPEYLSFLSSTFGKKYFIPAGKSISGVKQTIGQVQTHVREGGITLLFPAGGGDEDRTTHFKKGFGSIIQGIPEQSMVYAFHFDEHGREAEDRFYGAASDIWIGKRANINKWKQTLTVGVEERYTQTGQWQQLASEAAKGKKRETVYSEYYTQLFQNPDSE